MSELHGQVEDVKGVMGQNIAKIMQRGENLERLEQKTTELGLNVRNVKLLLFFSQCLLIS